MNERIDEFVVTARQQAISDTKDGGKQFDLDLFHEKFAELIVRDCMILGFNAVYEVVDDSKAFAVYQNIKQHFGVNDEQTTD
jgi:hypothetical protein